MDGNTKEVLLALIAAIATPLSALAAYLIWRVNQLRSLQATAVQTLNTNTVLTAETKQAVVENTLLTAETKAVSATAAVIASDAAERQSVKLDAVAKQLADATEAGAVTPYHRGGPTT
jgi:hypothetical protein